MADVLLEQTTDGGDVELVGGTLTGTDGFETAIYLSLFGGNEEDSGRADDDHRQWWGNLTDPNESQHQRSETQHILRAYPLTSASRRAIEIAAERDLSWVVADEHARAFEVSVTIPSRNRVLILIELISDNGERRRYEISGDSPNT